MKLYLAGPMRGIPEFNYPAFGAAAASLRTKGHEVFNPAEADNEEFGVNVSKGSGGDDKVAAAQVGMDPLAFRRNVFERDAIWIARHAEGIALLPKWEASAGARAERALAEAIGLQVFLLEPLADGAYAMIDAKAGGR